VVALGSKRILPQFDVADVAAYHTDVLLAGNVHCRRAAVGIALALLHYQSEGILR